MQYCVGTAQTSSRTSIERRDSKSHFVTFPFRLVLRAIAEEKLLCDFAWFGFRKRKASCPILWPYSAKTEATNRRQLNIRFHHRHHHASLPVLVPVHGCWQLAPRQTAESRSNRITSSLRYPRLPIRTGAEREAENLFMSFPHTSSLSMKDDDVDGYKATMVAGFVAFLNNVPSTYSNHIRPGLSSDRQPQSFRHFCKKMKNK